MKKISKIIVLVACLLIITSIVLIFVQKNNKANKVIVWESVIEGNIEEPAAFVIKDFKESVMTFNDIDFSFVYPSGLLVNKIDGDISYYAHNFEIDFTSTMATFDEYTDSLKERCSVLYDECSLKRAKIDNKSYVFLQENLKNKIYQETLIILSNDMIINYHLTDNKLSDEHLNKIINDFSYKGIPSDKYSFCKESKCDIDLNELIGSKLTINFDKSKYTAASFNVNNSSKLYFSEIVEDPEAYQTIVGFKFVYDAKIDAINDITDITYYEYVGEEQINNKTLEHYTKFDGNTRETAYEFHDIYLDVINPNLVIKINVDTRNDSASEVIKEFTNYEIS